MLASEFFGNEFEEFFLRFADNVKITYNNRKKNKEEETQLVLIVFSYSFEKLVKVEFTNITMRQ